MGDPVTLRFEFRAPPTYRAGTLTWTYPADTLIQIDTLQLSVSRDSVWRLQTRVALFAPGTFRVDPRSLLLLGPDGDSLQAAFGARSVVVASVLGPQPDTARPADYKGLVAPPGRIPPWLWLALAILTGALALFWYARRRAPALRVSPPGPAPWEVALGRLAELEARGYHARGLPRPFAFELSEILRGYLEDRYGFVALEQTTAEIKASLAPIRLEESLRRDLLAALAACDLAKFARFHWPAPELASALQLARRFVTATKPEPRTESQAA